MYSFDKKAVEIKFQKCFDSFDSSVKSIRTGRASASFLENVRVEIYGSRMSLQETASISVLDNFTLSIRPFDASNAAAIAKGIQDAQLGVNPVQDGGVIRVGLPQMTEDRRKELSKLAEKYGEEGKIAMRNVRRDENDHIKKAEKNKEISEDDMKRSETEVQKILDSFVKKIDEAVDSKKKDLLKV